MVLADIIRHIEITAPLAAAAPWDKSGVQVASRRTEAKHLAVMLDPTPPLVREALNAGADMLLSHHPLLMQPRFLDALSDFHAVAGLLLTADVCLYSAHTSLDANLRGPAAWLADALRLTKRAALETLAPHPDARSPLPYGFGLAGDLPSPMPYADFTALLSRVLDKAAWSAAGPAPELVRRVAYCPGSGGGMAQAAQDAGADIFITGDVKYHAALDTRIRMLDVGHFALEDAMLRLFAGTLQQELPQLTVTYFPAWDPLAFEEAGTPAQDTYPSPAAPKEELH